ncbi:serine protease [Streptomyces monticola]|uniref:Serine protease n=1 Tax=Streptomyces monticola TaxID=2666263 RepID=A0ABW2JSU1_9ACTN
MAAGDARSGFGQGLVRICDLAGRPRGAGFVADELGTVVTSHEAVDGLARLVLHAPGERTCVVAADAVTSLPEADLALVRTEGLGLRPLPVTVREAVETGAYVRIAALGWRQARVLAAGESVTYTATDRFHLVPAALELAIGTDGSDALRLGGGAAGGPVLDVDTGAVLAVLGTALHSGHRAAGFAVPLREAAAAEPGGALAELLERNAATVPAYGSDLNLAAVLQLTATSVGSDGPRDEDTVVERPDTEREFGSFLAAGGGPGGGSRPGSGGSAEGCGPAAYVFGLVGDPGSGRSTELAALAARRARGSAPAPTVWLRGAGLRAGDASVADAVGRALEDAGRIVTASAEAAAAEAPGAEHRGVSGLGDLTPGRVARLVRDAGRPLLVLLDCPEEMPPVLAHRLAEWTAGTVDWLRATGARLVVACREEYWEQAGRLFPDGALYGSRQPRLPACVRLGGLGPRQALRARERYGIPEDAVSPADAGHPLALRLLSEVRAALPGSPPGRPSRDEIFTAYVDLMCLRVAVRLAAAQNVRGAAVRRLAAKVAGRLHEAARRCLGPGQGELDREAFEEVFPWATGFAPAVLTEGLLVPAGEGYRFAHEELADWIQGTHLDLDAALYALVHRWRQEGAAQAAERLPSRGPATQVSATVPRRRSRAARRTAQAAARAAATAASGTPGPARTLPVPRHRIGPVVQALLLLDRQRGSAELARRLEELVHAADHFTGLGATARGGDVCGAAGRAGDSSCGVAGRPGGLCGAQAGPGDLRGTQVGADDPRGTQVGPEGLRGAAVQGGEARGAAARERVVCGAGDSCGVAAEPGDLRRTQTGPDDLRGAGDSRGAAAGPDGLRGTQAGADDLRGVAGWVGDSHSADACWWAVRLLSEALLRVPDARPYLGVLRLLAERIVQWGSDGQGAQRVAPGGPGVFGPGFWRALPLAAADRMDLLRRLVVADPEPGAGEGGERFLDAVGEWLKEAPATVQPLLTRWFDDDRALYAAPQATVARAAQALLHTHRHRSLDDLTEALVSCGHPRADELLAALADEEPSAMCRAVDRWAHDTRPERRVAAAAYGLKAVPQVRTEADRGLLRYAALALLARPGDCTLHGAALALLVRDPQTRSRHLPLALRRFTAGDPQLPASALAAALTTHPEPVLAAFQARLHEPGPASGEVLRTLADVTTPALARRVAGLVQEFLELRPEAAAHAAAYVDRRLDQGPAARAVLFPLVCGLLQSRNTQVRRAVAPVLAAPGSRVSRPLRRELLDVLLGQERDPVVLDAVIGALAAAADVRGESRTRELVRRTGLLLVRTPEGAACFDRRLVELSRGVPGFARALSGWLDESGSEWAGLVGPSARRMIEGLVGARVSA